MSAVLQAQEPSARYLAAEQPTLVREFELLAGAEGGVARLRELILTLAVQGKLVPQCPGEAPASEILASARAAAAEKRRERRKNASSEIAPVELDEDSPALPHGWEWCRGVDLCTVVRGVTYQKADASDTPRGDYLPILRANNIRTTINFDDLVHVPGNLVNEEQLLRPGDFVVCLASGSRNLVGKAAMFTGGSVCSFGAFCGAIRPAVPLPFFSAFLASPLYRDAVSEASSGIGINNLKSSTLLGLAIALPPEAEQARIVARVDELMRLCDALEAKGRLEAEQHARLLGTLLGTLTDSSTSEELAANWQRVADHFDLLLDRPEAVDALEQTILQLAVRGLLVPQDPKELPAHVLLNEVVDTRVGHFGDGNDGRDGEEAEARSAARAFDIPRGWVWATLGQFTQIRGGKRLPVGQSFAVGRTPYGYIQITNMKMGTVLLDHLKYLEPETFAAIKKYTIDQDDLYITIARTIGQVGEVPPECHGMNLTENAAKIVFRSVDKKWLRLVLSSPFCQSQFIEKTVQQAQPKLALHRIASAKVPLPPLAEQQRIVARVTELRRLCADLRQRLAASQTTQSHLAEALVDMAVA